MSVNEKNIVQRVRTIKRMLSVALLICGCWGATARGDDAVLDTSRPASAGVEAIQLAIDGLNSPNFSQREQATRELWAFGVEARLALELMASSENLETRQRARQVLADFEYGITPDVPPHVVKLLRQFRDGSAEVRVELMKRLIAEGDYRLLASLLERTENRSARNLIALQSIMDTPLMLRLIREGELTWWLDTVHQGMGLPPRHEVIANWLTAPGVVQELDRLGQLDVIDVVIAGEPGDDERFRFLRRLFVQRNFLDHLATPAHVDRLLHYMNSLENAESRHELFARFLSLTREVTLYDQPTLGKVVQFASLRGTRKSLPELWDSLLTYVMVRDEVINQMTVPRLTAFADSLDDAQFVQLVATLGSHEPTQRWLREEDHAELLSSWGKALASPVRQVAIADLVTTR